MVDQHTYDERWKTDPRAYLSKRRAATNVRAAGITFLFFPLLIWPPTISIGTGRDVAVGPAEAILGFIVMFALAIAVTFAAIRYAMVSVRLEGDELVIRNDFDTRRLRLDEIERFDFGYPSAKIPMQELAGSVVLRDGSVLKVLAYDKGLFFGKAGPTESSRAIHGALNAVLNRAGSN